MPARQNRNRKATASVPVETPVSELEASAGVSSEDATVPDSSVRVTPKESANGNGKQTRNRQSITDRASLQSVTGAVIVSVIGGMSTIRERYCKHSKYAVSEAFSVAAIERLDREYQATRAALEAAPAWKPTAKTRSGINRDEWANL